MTSFFYVVSYCHLLATLQTVSLLKLTRQSCCGSNFYRTFKVFQLTVPHGRYFRKIEGHIFCFRHCNVCIVIILETFCCIFDNWISALEWIWRWKRYENSATMKTLGMCQYSKLEYIILSLCYSFCKHNRNWQICDCFIL